MANTTIIMLDTVVVYVDQSLLKYIQLYNQSMRIDESLFNRAVLTGSCVLQNI